MRFESLIPATFVEKCNRFVCIVSIDHRQHRCHIPNTGRLQELLFAGNDVLVSHHDEAHRKTAYTLHLAKKGAHWVSINAHLPNQLAIEALRAGLLPHDPASPVQREVTYHRSRFDLYLPETRHFIEVKGVTLERGGWSYFPDAPTLRGTKHLGELVDATKEGYGCSVLFVVQLAFAHGFSPHRAMDPAFSQALFAAKEAGVHLMALACTVGPTEIVPTHTLPIELEATDHA